MGKRNYIVAGIIVVIICIIVIEGPNWYKKYNAKIPLDAYIGVEEEKIAKKTGLKFKENIADCNRLPIPSGSRDNLSVKSANGLGIIYKENQPFGVFITNKKYMLYNVQIGFSEIRLYDKITLPYIRNFVMIEELSQGVCDTIYFETINGGLLAVSKNNISNKVVAITYYIDGTEYTKDLSLL